MSQNPNLERGIQLFEMGRYPEAKPYLHKAISDDSTNFISQYYLAQCYFLTDDIKNSKILTLELRKSAPNNDRVYFLLSQISLQEDKPEEALSHIDTSIRIDPYEEDYFGQKAYCLIQLKNYEQALKFANEGLKLNAKSEFCLNVRATALTKLGRKSEVKETIENILQDNPENAFSHANIGWSHLENNNRKEALNHFKESLKLDPNSEFARSGMVEAVKSKNKVYNLYLRYAFWISNKSSKSQWSFILGIYIIYRISVKALSASGLTFLAIPIIVLYILFALGSWIMTPLSNSILLFDNYGKYLLSKEDRLSGQVLISLLIASLVSIGLRFLLDEVYFLLISLTFLAMIIPATRGILAVRKNSKITNLLYAGTMLLVALAGFVSNIAFETVALIIFVMFIGYTWIGNLIR